MSWTRLMGLGLVAVTTISITLIVAHGLWERARSPVARLRVMLVNAATTITILLGVLTLFGALLIITTLCDSALLQAPVLEPDLGHAPSFGDHLRIARVVSCMATLGGTLEAVVESDVAVREAAYGYRSTDRSNEGGMGA